ncbi:MAG: hypothetical protein CEO22_371, partial [Candidatus Berkelbacteria bacterium Gr01-1014_85]
MSTLTVEVLILEAIGHGRQIFSYSVPDNWSSIEVGQRVLVELRDRPLIGVVIKLLKERPTGKPKYQLKPVLRLIDLSPLMSKAYLEWLQEMARLYRSTPAQLLRAEPPLPIKHSWLEPTEPLLPQVSISESTIQSQKKPDQKPRYLISDDYFADLLALLPRSDNEICNQGQTLIIAASLWQLETIKDLLVAEADAYSQKILELEPYLRHKHTADDWLTTLANQPILLGLRSMATLSLPNLSRVIVIEPDLFGQTESQSPYWSSLSLLIERQKIEQFQLFTLSASPPKASLSARHQSEPKADSLIWRRRHQSRHRHFEESISGYSLLSPEVRQLAQDCPGKILIISDSTTESWRLRCGNCHRIWHCQSCQGTNIQAEDELSCLSCLTKVNYPCPSCQDQAWQAEAYGPAKIRDRLTRELNRSFELTGPDWRYRLIKREYQLLISLSFDSFQNQARLNWDYDYLCW